MRKNVSVRLKGKSDCGSSTFNAIFSHGPFGVLLIFHSFCFCGRSKGQGCRGSKKSRSCDQRCDVLGLGGDHDLQNCCDRSFVDPTVFTRKAQDGVCIMPCVDRLYGAEKSGNLCIYYTAGQCVSSAQGLQPFESVDPVCDISEGE